MKTFGLKSIFALLAILALSFSACGGEQKPAEEPVVEEESAVETKAPAVVEEVAEEVAEEVEEVEPVAEEATAVEETASADIDGAKIFTKCVSCHGVNAEKSALGKSQVIAGWDAAKIEEALNGYKAGTYGGSMATIMKGQVAPLSDAEIKALAEYISSK